MSGVKNTITIYVRIRNNKGSDKNFLKIVLNNLISWSVLKIADTHKNA